MPEFFNGPFLKTNSKIMNLVGQTKKFLNNYWVFF